MRTRLWTIAVLLVSLILSGCGGGGSSLGSAVRSPGLFVTSGGATRALSVKPHISSFASSYDHIWVTIKSVTFDGLKGPAVAYSDPTGTTVDLKTLLDNTGAKFSLLGTLGIPADTYSDVKVVLSQDITLIPTGSSTGVAALFAGSVAGTKELDFTFSSPRTLTSDFALDLDLSRWTIDSSVPPLVTAFVEESDGSGLGDSGRQVSDDHVGIVSALAGTVPVQTFTMTTHDGVVVTVATSAITSLFSSDGSLNPTLANAQHVGVKGIFDVTTHTLNASAIMIFVGNPSETHASGVPSAGDAVAGTFALAVHDVEGFVPTGASITVASTLTTKFFNAAGTSISQTDFFTALVSATNVEVNGSFDSGSQTLTALSIRLEGDHEANVAQVQGAVSNGNLGALTFDIVAHEFEGLNVPPGSTVHVLATNSTTYLGPDRSALDVNAFFIALATASGAEVEGTYDPNTQILTAIRVQLRTVSVASQSSVDGAPSAIDGTLHTFSLTVQEWEDAQLAAGQVLSITTDGNTVYRDAAGNVITQDAFFIALASAAHARVEGVISGSTINAKLARILS